jgi:hypothetical protein
MHRRRRAMRLLPIALMALFAPLSLAAQEVALDVTASEMAQPMARACFPARSAAFPLPRPTTLRSATAAPEMSLRPVERDPWAAPRLRWDGHSQDMDWTLATMAALRGPGASLAGRCRRTSRIGARATRPRGRGRGGPSGRGWSRRSHGTKAPMTRARWAAVANGSGWCRSRRRRRGIGACQATSGDALLDGEANLRCGLRIMGATVPRDGVVSRGMRGVAADWGPFHSTRKREDMRQWLRAQDYCRPAPETLQRPIMRPVTG